MQSNKFLCVVVSAIVSLSLASTPAHAIWTPRMYHPELNSAGYAAGGPGLSADGLTVYFNRYVPSLGAKALFVATRPDLDSAFGPQTMIPELFHGKNVGAPRISADGLRLYYHELMGPDERVYIRMAVRSDPTQPWTVARTFEEIHSAGKSDVSPSLSGDELIMVYQLETGLPGNDSRYVCITTRPSVDAPFGAPTRVHKSADGLTSGPHLSPDGLELYFTRYLIAENSGDIVVAKRASTSEPFGLPVPFPPFNTVGLSELSVNFTPDMKQICYNGTWVISPFTEGIYTSYWYEPEIGYDLLDSSYRAELVAAYVSPTGSRAGLVEDMAFDGSGSLYLTHPVDGTGTLTDGFICKVTPDGKASSFVTALNDPYDIVWGGGTPYGDYLYVADQHYGSSGRIWKISPTGAKSSFASPQSHPLALELDRVGLYGGQLYTATCTNDHIWGINPAGAMTKFSDFPYNDDPGWGVGGMAFAPQGPYKGLMYSLTFGVTPAGPNLMYTLDGSGTPTAFASAFVSGGKIRFDNTAQQYFGGGLYARAALQGDPYRSIFHVSPVGQNTCFVRKANPDQGIAAFTFGPDGAMYVAEYNSKYDATVISRILPAGPYLAALGNIRRATIAKQKAIADVNEAITREKLALKALTELVRTPGLNGAAKRGVMAAYVKVHIAKVQEETALRMLLQTLPLLDNAWDIILGQVAPGVDAAGSVPTRPTPLKP